MIESKKAAVSVVGTGIMGSAIATRLLGTGHAVTVFDLDTAKVATLVAKGARAAASAREAGNALPTGNAPSRTSWRIARWILTCNGSDARSGSPIQAFTDSSCACLNIGMAMCGKVVGLYRPF